MLEYRIKDEDFLSKIDTHIIALFMRGFESINKLSSLNHLGYLNQKYISPTWISDSKPDHNSAKLIFELVGKQIVELGETCLGTLYPLAPELWANVKRGDILCAMEGNKQIGEGTITDVLQDWEIGGDYMPQEYK